MVQFGFMFMLTAICTLIAWVVMWWLATKHNRDYIRYLVNELGCSNGKEEADESAQKVSNVEERGGR